MNILDYINKINEIYGKDEPRNMELAKAEFSPVFDPDLEQSEFLRPGETLEDWKPNPFLKPHAEGGRIGLQGGQLVRNTADGSRPGYKGKKYNWTTIDGVKHPVFIEGPNKGKINWRTTKTVDGKIKTVWTPISKEDLIAQFKKGQLDKIQGAVYSVKDATQLRADLPEGIILSKGAGKKGAYSYRVSWVPRGEGEKARVMLPATEDNIEDLIKRQKVHMKKNYPNILSNEAFENLRMSDENINLTKKQFAEKLNKLGHKTYRNLEFNTKNVSNIETSLNIHKLTNPASVHGRIRSISEAKNIIREKQGGNVWLKEIMNKPKEIRDAEIRIKANQMLGEEYTRKKMGIFAHTNTKEAQMFKNWFAAFKTGYSDRIQIGGKFDGKDLRHRRNWPKKPNGDVNWQATGKDGKSAWQSVEFTDTKVPDGKGGFKETKFTWDKTVKNGNIGQQVDNAFGSGFFNKSTKAYDLQKLGSTKNIMFRGKSIPVSQAIAEKMIIDQYKLDNKGRMPTQNQIDTRRKAFSYDEVHHPRGVGNDPYFTENTFRTANRELNYAEKTYRGKITEAGGNPRLLSQAKKDYIKNIEDISGKYGGIRYEVDGKMVGTKGTHASITTKAGEITGLSKDKGFRNYLKELGIKSGDNAATIASKIKKAPIPNKLKGALMGIVGAYGTITGADFLKKSGILFDKEFEQTASAVDAPVVAQGLSTSEKAAIGTGTALGIGTKAGRKFLGAAFNLGLGPTGAAALIYGLRPEGGYDLSKTGDRLGFEAEAAFASPLVKGAVSVTDKIKNPMLRKIAERGSLALMSPAMALRLARVATPLGIASLAGEGLWHLGKKGYSEHQKMKGMTEKEKSDYLAQRYEDLGGVYGEGAADGGRIGRMGGGMVGIRKPHAIPPERQGLRSIMIGDMDD